MTTHETDAILVLERRRCAAISTADAAALREILSDDYRHVHANGRIDDLPTYLAAVTERPRECERGLITVRQYGAAAVLVGEQTNTFQTHKSVVVVQQVAVRQEGTWRFVSTQVTRKATDAATSPPAAETGQVKHIERQSTSDRAPSSIASRAGAALKPIPRSILIFGAAAHIGGPLAAFLSREAPSIRLRLATRSPVKAESLRKAFPAAEVVNADYVDLQSMRKAVDGMEGVFVITPGGTDERLAMTNLVDALKASGSVIHLLRQVGLQPEANPRRIPQSLRAEESRSLPVQHPIAKQILDDSGLPVTYLNCGATFMDNFIVLGMYKALRRERKLIWPERLIPWIDPRDVGEVAGRLFLSDNHRHIGQFHTLNNGHDLMRFHEVAKLMSEVWNEPISHDSSKESFFANYAQIGARLPVLWEFFQYEQDNEVVWARNDFVERMLGRKPKTLREWLIEHRDAVLGTPATAAP